MTRPSSLLAIAVLSAPFINRQSTTSLHVAEARKDRINKKNVNKREPTASPSYNPTEWPTWFPTEAPTPAEPTTPRPTNKRQAAKDHQAPAPLVEAEADPLRPPAPAAPKKPTGPKDDIAPPPLVEAGIVIANDDTLDLPPGTEEAFVGVLQNDIGSGLRVQSITSQGAFGQCAISITLNEVVYSPPSATFIGSDECTYEACDGEDDCDTARLRVTIKEVITSDPTLDVTRPPSPEPTAQEGTSSTLSPTGTVGRPTARPITPFPTEGEPEVDDTDVPTFQPTIGEEEVLGSYSYDSYDSNYYVVDHFSSKDDKRSGHHYSKSGKTSKGSKGSWHSTGSGSHDNGSWDTPIYDSPSYDDSGKSSSSSGGSWSGSSSSSSQSGKSGKTRRRNLRH